MQLTYRGANYQHKPLHSRNADLDLATVGKYRGATFYISSAALVSHQSLVAYRYRGVDYTKGSYIA